MHVRQEPWMSNNKGTNRVLIVGGVAGGATCATRVRRLDEAAEIIIFERGPHVSFANCGLPYYVGNVIKEESKLLLANPALFRDRFNIDVRIRNEVTAIDRTQKSIRVLSLETGQEYSESYDALLLSPGAAPIRPAWPGVDLPGIFSLRNVPDSVDIRKWIDAVKPRKAVVVGAGFIGLEMAENMVHRGLEVTVLEMANQVMPPLDPEMAEYAQIQLESHGVSLHLGDGVSGFARTDGGLVVETQQGQRFDADLVILSIGVRPEAQLARNAGLEIGARGGIRADEHMRTNDPHIWAVGDAVEVRNRVTGGWDLIPLAGPANRQARIAADSICGRDSRFSGVQGTAVCGFFNFTVAMTGATEKALQRAKIDDYNVIYLHPNQHVGYYPGAKPIHMKLAFRTSDGLILGAQAVGEADVARRIDVIATAMQMHGTVYDLEELELCYAPQYGAAKDPVNQAGMIACNVLRKDMMLAPWTGSVLADSFVLDVREPGEVAAGSIPGSVNIPLGQLRSRLHELPRDKAVLITCAVGQRGYYACRILTQNGFDARNLSGGYSTYHVLKTKE